jgi:hypothetical protein
VCLETGGPWWDTCTHTTGGRSGPPARGEPGFGPLCALHSSSVGYAAANPACCIQRAARCGHLRRPLSTSRQVGEGINATGMRPQTLHAAHSCQIAK